MLVWSCAVWSWGSGALNVKRVLLCTHVYCLCLCVCMVHLLCWRLCGIVINFYWIMHISLYRIGLGEPTEPGETFYLSIYDFHLKSVCQIHISGALVQFRIIKYEHRSKRDLNVRCSTFSSVAAKFWFYLLMLNKMPKEGRRIVKISQICETNASSLASSWNFSLVKDYTKDSVKLRWFVFLLTKGYKLDRVRAIGQRTIWITPTGTEP